MNTQASPHSVHRKWQLQKISRHNECELYFAEKQNPAIVYTNAVKDLHF